MDSPRSEFTPYFASAPSTPRGSSGGAQFYTDLMDTYHRRLRKAPPTLTNDAAGLLCGSRYHGRGTPLKGKGAPPPDNHEPGFTPSKKTVPGKSYVAVKDLLVHHEEPIFHNVQSPRSTPRRMSNLSQSMTLDVSSPRATMQGDYSPRPMSAAGSVPSSPAAAFRPCLKLTEHSFRSSLQGCGLSVIEEAPQHKPLRKAGTAAPTNATKARVLVLAEDVAFDVASFEPQQHHQPAAASRNSQWAQQTHQALEVMQAKQAELHERPSTAPPRMMMNEARRYYQATQTANNDLYQYRHSGGICPQDYKMNTERNPAPQLSSPDATSAKDAFNAARMGYSYNRVRSLMSCSTYA